MAEHNLRIVHVLAPAPVGGAERVVTDLAAGQAARGHRVVVVAVVDDADHAFVTGWNGGNAERVPIVVHARAYVRERRALRTLLERLRADIVHTHGYRSDVVDAPVARRIGIPTVTTVHGFTGGSLRNRLYETVQTRAFKRFAAVVVVSRALRERLMKAGVSHDLIHVVPNAWSERGPLLPRQEARRRLGIEDGGQVIGWVGRLSHEKGPDVFVEAMRHIDVAVKAAVVGDGPMLAELKALADQAGLGSRIRWTGRIDEAGRLFSAFDAFVLSSRTEGTPMTLLEAMAAGIPVVATRVGGVPDAVPDGEAMLVEPEQPTMLAAAITDTLRDGDAAAARGAAARARVLREYDAAAWLDRYADIYAAVLTHRPAGSPA